MTDIEGLDRPVTDAIRPDLGIADSITSPADLGPPAVGPANAEPASSPTTLTAAQLALYAGWTMAVLYAAVPLPAPKGPPELPTVHELPKADRRVVELGRLQRLIDHLAELPGSAIVKTDATWMKADDTRFATRLRELHLTVLGALAASGLELELAYELGRSLRDTIDPRVDSQHGESPAAAVVRQLGRGRIARLQEWLATLSAEFPPQVAAIVSASLGTWSDFSELTMGSLAAGGRRVTDKNTLAGDMRDCLLRQGDVWLMLLVGVQSTSGLLTPEGYVAAGEAALHRSARIVRGVLKHYWGVALCLAAALGGVLYLAAAQLRGGSQVWTSIAAIGSTLGISAQSIRSAIGRLSTEAERPVLSAAEEDAKAWAITTLPQGDLTGSGTRKLRKSGIASPVGLGRF